jgi:hypothetical protein
LRASAKAASRSLIASSTTVPDMARPFLAANIYGKLRCRASQFDKPNKIYIDSRHPFRNWARHAVVWE